MNIENLLNRKAKGGNKIVCLTAYTFPIAKILDPLCDIILVGDSLGMAIYGFENTNQVSLSMMIEHGKAVRKATKNAMLVVDMSYGSYEKSKEEALKNARLVIEQTGCDAIKIEINEDLIETTKYLVEHKIPVMGHVGLLPQQVISKDQYRYFGKKQDEAQKILQNAKKIDEAGAFAIVIEAVPKILADQITKEVSIPTIGIGASDNCDGQILVIDDLLGLNQEFKPRFVKRYEDLALRISSAVSEFRKEVIEGKFPEKNNLI